MEGVATMTTPADDDDKVPFTYRAPKAIHAALRREAYERHPVSMSDIITEALTARYEHDDGRAGAANAHPATGP
jgi:hypothetical protein